MAIDFPASPTEGQEFTSGGQVFVYRNGVWVPRSSESGIPDAPDSRRYVRSAGAWIAQVTPDAGWIAPTFVNGWSDYMAGYGPAGFRKLSNGMVIMRGLVKGGGGGIFTLPVGYRPNPDQALLLSGQCNPNVQCRIDINTSGGVTPTIPTGGTNGWVSLAQITFLAEA